MPMRTWPRTILPTVNPGDDEDGESASPDVSESDRRRKALDRMVEIADEAGMYDRTASRGALDDAFGRTAEKRSVLSDADS